MGPEASFAASPVVDAGGRAAPLLLPSAAPVAVPIIYFTADEMPTFPGGDATLLKFLSSRLNYPAAALDKRLSGAITLRSRKVEL